MLREEGKAYIFPLTYEPIDDNDFFGSLNEFCEKTSMRWEVLDEYGESINGEYMGQTLLLEK